jgi:hypothetical protein
MTPPCSSAKTGAAHDDRSPERLAQRNGYRGAQLSPRVFGPGRAFDQFQKSAQRDCPQIVNGNLSMARYEIIGPNAPSSAPPR